MAYRHYKAGYLPEQGGTLDQVDKMMSLLLLMDIAYSDCEAVKRQQERDKAAAGRG